MESEPFPCLFTVIDNLQIGDEVEFEVDLERIANTTTCSDCSAPFTGPSKIIGIFMGHQQIDNYIYDDIVLNEPFTCPNCGLVVRRRLFWCGRTLTPSLSGELFRKVKGIKL